MPVDAAVDQILAYRASLPDTIPDTDGRPVAVRLHPDGTVQVGDHRFTLTAALDLACAISRAVTTGAHR